MLKGIIQLPFYLAIALIVIACIPIYVVLFALFISIEMIDMIDNIIRRKLS
jgi:hypothetical protein